MSKQPLSHPKAGPVEGPLADNERLKRESNFLRGTIEQDLQDPLTGGFNGDNFQPYLDGDNLGAHRVRPPLRRDGADCPRTRTGVVGACSPCPR